MEQYVTLYKVQFYSDVDSKIVEECGVLISENYTNAAQQIENYYGNDLVEISHISLYEPRTLILPNDKFDDMKTYLEGLI